MGATSGAEIAYSFGAPEFTPGFKWGSCYLIFSFIFMFCRSLFVLLCFFFWPLCCLFLFDILFLIAPLVPSPFHTTLHRSVIFYQWNLQVFTIKLYKTHDLTTTIFFIQFVLIHQADSILVSMNHAYPYYLHVYIILEPWQHDKLTHSLKLFISFNHISSILLLF